MAAYGTAVQKVSIHCLWFEGDLLSGIFACRTFARTIQIMTQALDAYCTAQESDKTWQTLLDEENPQKTESNSWNEYLGPILAFKLVTVLSGSASLEGKIPRSAMSKEMSAKLVRLVSIYILHLALISMMTRQK